VNRSVLVDAPGRHRIVDCELTEPQPDEARVRVVAAGMCGSDRELYTGTRPAPFVRYPIVPGHEWSGVVDAVGADVPSDLLGAAVVGEGFRACLVCTSCRSGATNLCEAGYEETGFTCPGAFAEHLVLPARLLHVLDPHSDLRAAALLEPAACVAAAVEQSGLAPDQRAAVVGAGTLGMLALGLLAARSPAELLAVDTRPDRADLAQHMGATSFATTDHVATAAEGAGFDVVVEAAGAADSAQLATRLARRGGRVVLTGIPGNDVGATLPVSLLVTKQLTVATVFGAPSSAWRAAVRAFNSGALDPAPLITHELPLDEYGDAMALLAEGRPDVGKVLLRP
jgi:2-desacetyl-2-hydroxyethyl bacteriochlorophyllide A dehydrogenase